MNMHVFNRTRLILTAWYLTVLMSVSILFSVLIYQSQMMEIRRFVSQEKVRIQTHLGLGPTFVIVDEDFFTEAKKRIAGRLVAINGVIFVVTGALGYFLAGRTLSPIEKMVAEQRRFISDAAHELRTPITAMRTSLEVYMRDKKATLRDAKVVIGDNIQDVIRLQSLIDNLLTLSQIQEGNGHLPYRATDLGRIAHEVGDRLKSLGARKNLRIITDTKKAVVRGYAPHLEELVTILVDNAIKYSNDGAGDIKITVHTDSKDVSLSVQDHGIGIKERDQARIFDRFYRSDTARTKSDRGGYGIGLSIAQKIVDAHRGDISVTSKVGEGSLFTVSLPSFS